jgi:hypothetical protein
VPGGAACPSEGSRCRIWWTGDWFVRSMTRLLRHRLVEQLGTAAMRPISPRRCVCGLHDLEPAGCVYELGWCASD